MTLYIADIVYPTCAMLFVRLYLLRILQAAGVNNRLHLA